MMSLEFTGNMNFPTFFALFFLCIGDLSRHVHIFFLGCGVLKTWAPISSWLSIDSHGNLSNLEARKCGRTARSLS